MKLFLIAIFSFFMTQGCAAQSELPKETPENLTFSLYEGGGMSRYHKKIKIENGVLEFEELQDNGKNLNKWSAKISREDLVKLYQSFVENKFDTIKNDERKGIVYDAGSETISISINELKSFNVTYGKNSPLSGKNLSRYQEVRKAIYDLLEQYQKTGNQNMSEAEKYIQGKWRAAGEHGKHAWFSEWIFDSGEFRQLGYPPLFQEGKYKIISVADNKITVELYDQKGTFGEEKRRMEIIIDKETDNLTISNMKGFSRLNLNDAKEN